MEKPFSTQERYNVTDGRLSSLHGENNYAHVILTAEAGSLPTDNKELIFRFCHATSERQPMLRSFPIEQSHHCMMLTQELSAAHAE